MFCTLASPASAANGDGQDDAGVREGSPLRVSQDIGFLFLPLSVQVEERGQKTSGALQKRCGRCLVGKRRGRKQSGVAGIFLGDTKLFLLDSRKKKSCERKRAFFSLSNVLFMILLEHPKKCKRSCVLILCCAF